MKKRKGPAGVQPIADTHLRGRHHDGKSLELSVEFPRFCSGVATVWVEVNTVWIALSSRLDRIDSFEASNIGSLFEYVLLFERNSNYLLPKFSANSDSSDDGNQAYYEHSQALDPKRFDDSDEESDEENRSSSQEKRSFQKRPKQNHTQGVLSQSSRENKKSRRISDANSTMPGKARKPTKEMKAATARIHALEAALEEQTKKTKARDDQIKSLSSKKSRGGGRLSKMPLNAEVKKEVKHQSGALGNKLWRTTKFINNEQQELDACAVVMKDVHGISDLLESEDPAKLEENISAFAATYGSEVCTAVNTARSNSQSNIKKAYLKRSLKGKQMPTPQELLSCVLRKKELLCYPSDEETPLKPCHSDYENGVEDPEYKTDLAKYDQDIGIHEQKVALINLNREWFMWYWTQLLPCVAGSNRWSKNIRCYGCISDSTFPDNKDLKHITSSDEALVMVLYENCGQRFPFLHELAKKNGASYTVTKEDTMHARYQSAYSDPKAGQKKYGGWYQKGRERYAKLEKKIRVCKKKDHVLALEKALLAYIQIQENITVGGKKKRKGRDLDDFEQADPDNWRKVGVESDALSDTEGEDESDFEEFEPTYGKPRGELAADGNEFED